MQLHGTDADCLTVSQYCLWAACGLHKLATSISISVLLRLFQSLYLLTFGKFHQPTMAALVNKPYARDCIACSWIGPRFDCVLTNFCWPLAQANFQFQVLFMDKFLGLERA